MSKKKRRGILGYIEHLKPAFNPKTPHKKLTRKSLHPRKLKVGIDPQPYAWDPFPELGDAIERGGLTEGLRFIKRKARRKR